VLVGARLARPELRRSPPFDTQNPYLKGSEGYDKGPRGLTSYQPIAIDPPFAARMAQDVAAKPGRLDRKIEAVCAERRRVADLYQAGLIEQHELMRRATELDGRRRTLETQRGTLACERKESWSINKQPTLEVTAQRCLKQVSAETRTTAPVIRRSGYEVILFRLETIESNARNHT
jgi:hypothetical protein